MSRIKWLFIGPDGLRHGWRFLIFAAAIFLVVQFLEQPAIAFLAAKLHINRSALSAPSIIVSDGFDLIVILVVTGVAARFEQRRVDSYGLPVNEAFGGPFLGWSDRRFRGNRLCGSRDAYLWRTARAWSRFAWCAVNNLTSLVAYRDVTRRRHGGISLSRLCVAVPMAWRRFLVGRADHDSVVRWRPSGETTRKRNRYWNDIRSRHCPLYQRSRHRLALVGGWLACGL